MLVQVALPLPPGHPKKLRLGPVHAALASLSPAQVKAELRRRWAKLERPPLKKLAHKVLRGTPAHLLVGSGTSWIVFSAPDDGGSYYVGEPLPPAVLARALGPMGFRRAPTLRELFSVLGPFREDLPPSAGGLELPRRATRFPAPGKYSLDRDLEDADAWDGSYVFYTALNGDRVVVHPSGRAAWALLGEQRMEPVGTLDDLLTRYARALGGETPFDSYS